VPETLSQSHWPTSESESLRNRGRFHFHCFHNLYGKYLPTDYHFP
jgi:hypothetical protein